LLCGLALVLSACADEGSIPADTDAGSTGSTSSGPGLSTSISGTSASSSDASSGEASTSADTSDGEDTGTASSSGASGSSSDTDTGSETGPAMVTLRVEKLGSGLGGVRSDPDGILCGQQCELAFEIGTTVELTAMASAASLFLGWSGGRCSGEGPCTLVLEEDTVVQATFVPEEPNVVFVTSTEVAPMAIGGLDGADQICADAADAAGLLGTYVAWLSTNDVDARDRLGAARGWVRPDGRPFADTIADLTSRIDAYPPRLDEYGNDLEAASIVTGTSTDGTGPGWSTFCADWTGDDGGLVGGGTADAGAGAWTQFWSFDCSTPQRLLCFGVDQDVAVAIDPVPGRVAFVSTAAVSATAGLDAFDATCQAEADDAGLTGDFLAAVATSTDSIAARFDTAGDPWVRVDGVAIVVSAADLESAEHLRAPLVVTADGSRLFGERVWTGTAAPDEAGPAEDACGDWSDPDIGNGWSALATESAYWTSAGGRQPCDTALLRVYCLEA
jgi:hypothetical protein